MAEVLREAVGVKFIRRRKEWELMRKEDKGKVYACALGVGEGGGLTSRIHGKA